MLAGGRRWLPRLLLALVVPTLLILGSEVCLRIGGYGYPTDFFLKVPDRQHFGSNRFFSRQFFPPAIARQPLLLRVPETKAPTTYRIFVLGASAAMGFPAPAFSFSRILEVMLADRFPQVNFEVINTSIVAVNSHVVRSIADDCARHAGDLYIIYLGNNEVIGPYGIQAGINRVPGRLSFIRLGLRFRETRIGQLYQQLAAKISGQDGSLSQWPGMEMYSDHLVSQQDPRLPRIHENFRRNLEAICRSVANAGAQTLLATVAVNLRSSPPFASLHRPDLTPMEIQQWDQAFQAGLAAEEAGRHAQAAARYEDCVRLDDHHAELNFRLGRVWLALGDIEQASGYFRRAREEDALRFRADSRINDIIRQVAAADHDQNIHLVDLESFLKSNEPGPFQIPGDELFYEHVHLKFAGNYLIASALLEEVSNLLPQQYRGDLSAAQATLSPVDCRRALTFTPWNEYNSLVNMLDLVKNPPFTNQMEHQTFIARLESEIEQLKRRSTLESMQQTYQEYRRALATDPHDLMLRFNYRLLLKELGFSDQAEVQLRMIRLEIPPLEH